jgi:DNA-binding NarL/FixJ family response regulator
MGRYCGAALVVDDDGASRDLLAELLGRAGIKSITAKHGDEALMAARASLPWLVITEIRLPDISGYELCRELREEFGEELAIIFLSSDRTDPLDRAAGLLLGADEYIAKPFDNSELLARIRRLGQRVGATESRKPSPNVVGGSLTAGGLLTAVLTSREREALVLLARGRKQREIAAELSIGEKTVASHLQRVLEKLGVHSRAHAVAIAYQDGIVGDLIASPV